MQQALTHIVEYAPYRMRNERCAIGMLVRLPDGKWHAHPATSLRKARAIDPSCNLTALRDGLHAVAGELEKNPEALALYANGIAGLSICQGAGQINYNTPDELERGVQWTLAMAVEPQRSHTPQAERAAVSRLFLEIKNAFNAFGWMAGMGEGTQNGRIVPRYPLSADEGLTLDFAQQSDHQFTAIQTLDWRHNAQNKRTESNAKLLTMGMAGQIVVPASVHRYAIFAGSSAPEARAALRLAERTCDDIFLEENAQDMDRLVDLIAQRMGQEPMPRLQTH